jgi:pyrroline-5-carboxylate reductase
MIGAGKMAQAIMEPMISKGVQPADKFYVYDVSIQAMVDSQNRLGVQTTDSLSEVINDADLVILAVKPQNLTTSFFEEIQKGKPSTDAIVLSIIAGKPMSEFYHTGIRRIVRSMPNTPAMIGQGMTVWSCTSNLTADERKKIRDVLSSCGKSVRTTPF